MRLLVVVITILLGCGGDSEALDAAADAPPDAPTSASEFNGLWLMTSLTLTDDVGTVRTLTRDGIPQAVRGDVLFASVDDTTGTIDVRQAVLEGGLLASEISTVVNAVTIEGDTWLVTDADGDVVVLSATRSADRLTLDLDAADPRNTNTEPPVQVVLDRVLPWSTTTVGSWDLVSMEQQSGTTTAGSCTELQPATTFGTIEMAISFNSRLLFERVMTLDLYSDDQCTVSTGTQVSTQIGMAEETAGATLSIWAVEDTTTEFIGFTLSEVGDMMTLTRVSCLPMPDCDINAPTEVVVRRAPTI